MTSTAVHSPLAILTTTSDAVTSVISSSLFVKNPLVWGQSWTSITAASGSNAAGMIQLAGNLFVRSAALASAMGFHVVLSAVSNMVL